MYRRKCTYRVLRAQRKKRNCISRESDSDSNSSNLSDYSISTSSSKSSSSYHLRDESLLNLSDTSKESTEDISTLVMSTLCSKEVIFIAALLLYAIQAGISNNSLQGIMSLFQADFHVVLFEDNVVEYISGSWLIGRSQCRWPKCDTIELKRLRSDHKKPAKDWEIYSCRILSSTSSEAIARNRLHKAANGEDELTTDIDQERASVPPKRFIHDQHQSSSSKRIYISTASSDSECNETEEDGELDTFFVPPFPRQSSSSSPTLVKLSTGRTTHGSSGTTASTLKGNSSFAKTDDTSNAHSDNRSILSETEEDFNMVDQSSRFQKIVLRELAAIRQIVEELSRNVAYIVSRRGIRIALPVSLPCSSEEDFDSLCEFAAIEANAENLKRQLSCAGGSCINDVVRRILRKLLKPQVASYFSFQGRGKKRAFINTPLWPVLRGASMLSIKTTEKDVEAAMKDQLKHAMDPLRSRKKLLVH